MSILKQTVRVSVTIQDPQFGVVDKNCKFQEVLYSVYPLKICVTITEDINGQRRKLVEWIIVHQQMDGTDSSGKIILSDEAHFHLDGFVNHQNRRFRGSENPHVTFEKYIHPQRVTVWCGFWVRGIVIGPHFLKITLVKQ